MKTFGTIMIISFLLLSGCKAKKDLQSSDTNTVKNELIELDKTSSTFEIASLDNISKEDLLFSIKETKIQNQQVAIQVQYGGGCVKPHVFELVTDGVIDQSGNMDFYLLHKTHGDKCKALLIENLVFDLAGLYNLKSDVLSSIRFNNMRKMDLE